MSVDSKAMSLRADGRWVNSKKAHVNSCFPNLPNESDQNLAQTRRTRAKLSESGKNYPNLLNLDLAQSGCESESGSGSGSRGESEVVLEADTVLEFFQTR